LKTTRTTIFAPWRWPLLAFSVATIAALSCARAAAGPGGAERAAEAQGREPDLRVGLALQVGRAVIGGQGDVAVIQGGRPAFRMRAGQTVTLVPEGRGLAVSGAHSGRYEALAFSSLTRDARITVAGKAYRGVVEVIARDGALNVINALPLEQYLMGVVNAEMGRQGADARAALEAQAIVSRTYALRNAGRFAADGFDLRAGVSDQVYGGVEFETEVGVAAVRATTGVVLTYRGHLITPFFHSTCGFSTAAPEEVFRTVRGEPYLKPVSDRRPGGGHYCDISPRFRWTVVWDGDVLRDILRRTLPAVVGIDGDAVTELRDVYIRRTGASGRPTDVRVRVRDGEIPVAGHDFRSVFETPDGTPLGSGAVALQAERRGDRVGRLTASGRGWGHGVGMCQWGAVGRARAGQHARTILTTYFPGTSFARRY